MSFQVPQDQSGLQKKSALSLPHEKAQWQSLKWKYLLPSEILYANRAKKNRHSQKRVAVKKHQKKVEWEL
ncbi:hypothetical protein [Acetobacter syzygii]|uniref:Uncharacterized protein n=1 Tax=Acetobacter syzygii TaxID=146476 RepID=A0A270BUQ0_9PROT|nr:hypothetical protein [Acetobacter syzygii]NSL91842.1 hypothetical protein [Acetobacter syzygii]PAL28401.1 hypothetical protein B9K05_03755 [Acetobacter syzygii]PAL28829.1 hypothetical protein B9K04_01740 [Acetobacter syzygii]